MVLNVTHGIDSCSLLSIIPQLTLVCRPIGTRSEDLPTGLETPLDGCAHCLPIRSVLGQTMVL